MSAPASAAAAVPRSTTLAVLAATTAAQIASVMGVAVFPVIAPRLAAEMGVAPALIGYQVSLIYGAAAIGAPLMSFAVPRWGACRTTQIGLGLCSIAMLLAWTSWLPLMAIASVLVGVGMTIMTPASAHLLFRYSPAENRNLMFSLKQTGVPLGWMIMALAAPGITLAFGWRWSLVPVLGVALTTLIALQFVRSRWDDDRSARAAVRMSPREGLALTWRTPVLRWLALAALCLTFVQLSLSTFVVTLLVEEAAYSLVAAGVMLSLVQGAGAAGRVVWGLAADRSGNTFGVLHKLAIVTTICCVVMVFLTPAWPVLLVGVFFMVFGAAAVGWNGLFLAEIARASPRGMVSVATSAAMTWNFGGVLLGPALFATAYRGIGSYTSIFALLAIVAAAGVVMFTLGGAAVRRQRD
jgi:predicted MFS family arabinose efflux permease